MATKLQQSCANRTQTSEIILHKREPDEIKLLILSDDMSIELEQLGIAHKTIRIDESTQRSFMFFQDLDGLPQR